MDCSTDSASFRVSVVLALNRTRTVNLSPSVFHWWKACCDILVPTGQLCNVANRFQFGVSVYCTNVACNATSMERQLLILAFNKGVIVCFLAPSHVYFSMCNQMVTSEIRK